jgi:hypothetical protein
LVKDYVKNVYDNVRKNVELPVQDTNHTQDPQVAVDSPSPIKKPNSSTKTSSIVQWLRSIPSCQMVELQYTYITLVMQLTLHQTSQNVENLSLPSTLEDAKTLITSCPFYSYLFDSREISTTTLTLQRYLDNKCSRNLLRVSQRARPSSLP